MRSGSPIWIAANPMPGASYMVASMSSANARNGASTRSTGLESWRRMGSGRMMSGLIGMAFHLRPPAKSVNRGISAMFLF